MCVRIGDSKTRPNVRAGECLDRDVESVAGGGTRRPEIERVAAQGIAGKGLRVVSRSTVIPEHVKYARIELQMSIEQTAFRAGLVAPQCVLADARRRLGAFTTEQYPGAARSVALCGCELEEFMRGGLIGEPQLRQKRRVGSRRRRWWRSFGRRSHVRMFAVQANIQRQSLCQSNRHLAECGE